VDSWFSDLLAGPFEDSVRFPELMTAVVFLVRGGRKNEGGLVVVG